MLGMLGMLVKLGMLGMLVMLVMLGMLGMLGRGGNLQKAPKSTIDSNPPEIWTSKSTLMLGMFCSGA